jgi:hypothetical protein
VAFLNKIGLLKFAGMTPFAGIIDMEIPIDVCVRVTFGLPVR